MNNESVNPNEGLSEYFGMLNQTLERNSKIRELNRTNNLALVDRVLSYRLISWLKQGSMSFIVDKNGDITRFTVYDHGSKKIIRRTYY